MSNIRKYQFIISVDPGVKGGISIIKQGSIPIIYSIPVKTVTVNKKKKKIYDEVELSNIFRFYCKKKVLFVQEKVGVRPGEGGVSAFGFGKSTGLTLGMASMGQFDILEIFPRSWKKHYPEFYEDEDILILKGENKEISVLVKEINIKIKTLKDKIKTIKDKDDKKRSNKEINDYKNIVKDKEKTKEKNNRKIKARQKSLSRKIATKKLPVLKNKFELVQDDGKSDALLIALFVIDTFGWKVKE